MKAGQVCVFTELLYFTPTEMTGIMSQVLNMYLLNGINPYSSLMLIVMTYVVYLLCARYYTR